MSDDPCGPSPTSNIGLRVGAIFIILVTSLFGTLFPVLFKRIPTLRRAVPGIVFDFAKFFGSGVILATGFIHLLEPSTDSLGEGNTISEGGCISDGWSSYPFAFGICLTSLFITFVIQIIAFRLGSDYLERRGISNPQQHAHTTGHSDEHRNAPGHEHPGQNILKDDDVYSSEKEKEDSFADASEESPAAAQIIGVALLELGVIFHSLVIGLTLAVTAAEEFKTLFVVIIFHQMFEGLGLGTRLAFLKLPSAYSWVPFGGGILYSCVTPLGMAIGLGVRESLSMGGGAASVTSGVLDAISAGVLIYTATVELIAHEFILNPAYHKCSWGKLWFSLISFALGTGIMALLGKWA